jgi:hypothetical protein
VQVGAGFEIPKLPVLLAGLVVRGRFDPAFSQARGQRFSRCEIVEGRKFR